MEKEKIVKLIEAIVFVSGEQIDRSDIISKLELTVEEFDEAVVELKRKYQKENSGIVLLEFGTKLQFCSNSELVEDVMKVICPVRERALTKSAIETLSIIAYKQPITRLEIEEIRGVASDYALGILMDHNLIAVVGKKDAVGKPLLFGTTEEFLKRFNLDTIEELPDRNQLTERIRTLREATEKEGAGLYREFDISTDEIIPEKIRESLNSSSVIQHEESLANIDGDDFV